MILPAAAAGIHPTINLGMYRRNVRVNVTITIEDEASAPLSEWAEEAGGRFVATMGGLGIALYSDREGSYFWTVKRGDRVIATAWEPSIASARRNAVQAAREAASGSV